VIVESTAIDAHVAGAAAPRRGTTVMSSTAPADHRQRERRRVDQKYWRILANADTFSLQTLTMASRRRSTLVRLRAGTLPSLTIGVAGAGVGEMHVAFRRRRPAGSTSTTAARGSPAARAAAAGYFQFILNGAATVALSVTQAIATLKAHSSRTVRRHPATFDRTGTDGTIVSLRQDNTEEGTISVAGTTVSYNAFMGSHYTQLMPGQAEPATGTVVVTTGREIPSHGSAAAEKFVFVEPSRERNARGTYGVWFASLNRTADGYVVGRPDAQVYQVAGVGPRPASSSPTPAARSARVTSSARHRASAWPSGSVTRAASGYDPLVRDTTLGKALVDVDFSSVAPDPDGVRRVLVPAVLYAG
jgi:hypothetical protein